MCDCARLPATQRRRVCTLPLTPPPPPYAPPSHPAPGRRPCARCAAAAASPPGSGGAATLNAAGSGSGGAEGRPLPGLALPGPGGAPLPLLEQRFDIGGALFRLVAPADVDGVIDAYIAAGAVDCDPYWTRVWPSAVALAHQLLARPELVAGARVADLGAGLGVAGLAAALAGAAEVVLLDREPLALQCAALSAAATGCTRLPPSSTVPDIGPLLAALAALPPLPEASTSAPAGGGPPQQQQRRRLRFDTPIRRETFDWHADPGALRGTFDVVLCCDVLYEDDAVAPVAAAAAALLRRSGGRLLLADPPNRKPANRARLGALLAAQSPPLAAQEAERLSCEVNKLDVEMLGGVTTETLPIEFMLFRSSAGRDTISLKLP